MRHRRSSSKLASTRVFAHLDHAINASSCLEEANHDRTKTPVVCSQSERSMLNEVDMDFRIPGLPHSVVKQAETLAFVIS